MRKLLFIKQNTLSKWNLSVSPTRPRIVPWLLLRYNSLKVLQVNYSEQLSKLALTLPLLPVNSVPKSKMPPQLMFVVLISRYGNYRLNLVLYVSQALVMCVKVLGMFTEMPPLLILQDAVLKVAMLFSSKEKTVKLHL